MRAGTRNEPDARTEAPDHLVRSVQLVLHEIRQPLAALFALAEAARSRPGVPEEVRTYLGQIIEQAGEISDAAWSVLSPDGAAGNSGTEPADADEIVTSVLAGFGLTWTGSFLRQGHRGSTPVAGDRASVRRCLVNVVDNAVRAAGPAGRVTVGVRVGTDAVRVLVDDDGPGFGQVPSRSGMGLRITRQALEGIGGDLSVAPSGAGGVCVVLTLLRADAGCASSDRSARAI